MGCLWCLVKTAAILLVFCFIVHLWVSNKDYMFSEEEIAAVTRKHIGPDAKVTFNKVHTELLRKYPGHILPKKDLQWIFVNAGGWMGSFCLLHASVTEYVLFFGTPITTEGHSGRYWANISDTVVTGTFRQWIEGSMDQNVFKPGDTILHAWGEATAVNFEAGTWMVEYGRGFIPSTLGFALADTIFSTQDFLTMFYTFRIYTKAMWQEAAANLVDFKAYIRDSL